MYRRYVKRIIDVILSLVGLILASWLYLLIMIAIEIDDPGPVFFSQKRVGIHKKYFQLYKFRSMKMSTPHDMPTHLLENPEQYITRVGKFLRKTSLDEIPQLWNILRGDMSVIGPRPALWNQEDLLAERDKYGANDVKPGLSGWAQICGRDELEIADKARLDGEYVQRMSFGFDRRSINPFKDMKLLKTYRQMLDELQPDMVVTYSIKPNIYMGTACKAKGIPYVANVQGLGTAFEKPVLSSVVSVMYRSALRKAKTVFFENEENAQFFLNKKIIFHRQVRVLPGAGINLDEYPCVPMGDDGVCSFLFVGRIMKEKGVDEFFSAARTLKAEFGEKVAFDVVGFYEDAYKEQVDQLVADGIVRFHGFQTDVHPFYEAADCVVLPSYHEGMSNVLLEGAATGRALITSDIPGCREAVEDGVSGYLCPAQDAEGLTRAMRDFAQQSFDRQVQMGQSGRALAERKFDKQLVVAKTLDGLGLPAAVRN